MVNFDSSYSNLTIFDLISIVLIEIWPFLFDFGYFFHFQRSDFFSLDSILIIFPIPELIF